MVPLAGETAGFCSPPDFGSAPEFAASVACDFSKSSFVRTLCSCTSFFSSELSFFFASEGGAAFAAALPAGFEPLAGGAVCAAAMAAPEKVARRSVKNPRRALANLAERPQLLIAFFRVRVVAVLHGAHASGARDSPLLQLHESSHQRRPFRFQHRRSSVLRLKFLPQLRDFPVVILADADLLVR